MACSTNDVCAVASDEMDPAPANLSRTNPSPRRGGAMRSVLRRKPDIPHWSWAGPSNAEKLWALWAVVWEGLGRSGYSGERQRKSKPNGNEVSLHGGSELRFQGGGIALQLLRTALPQRSSQVSREVAKVTSERYISKPRDIKIQKQEDQRDVKWQNLKRIDMKRRSSDSTLLHLQLTASLNIFRPSSNPPQTSGKAQITKATLARHPMATYGHLTRTHVFLCTV